jgi:hypothetical protein
MLTEMNELLSGKPLYGLLFFLCFLPPAVHAQDKSLTCSDLKNGIFHFYPKNSMESYLDVRDGNILRESVVSTGDTTLWEIKWLNDCTYSLKYLSGNYKMNEDALSFLKKHRLVYEIATITNDYYLFKGYVDKPSDIPIQTDTMWLAEKIVTGSNELFKPVANSAVLKKNHFSDSSGYAVLYLYRPGKLTNSLGNYIVYFDNNLLCVARNKSGYIFKILKEGKFKAESRLYKDKSSVDLDVKFGHVYYIKSMIHWGIYSRLYNFKLDMAIVDTATGKAEFEDVNLQ